MIKKKNERRPFCFISFQTEQAAQEVLRLQRHTIGDISVDVKRAKQKTLSNQQQQQLQQQMYDPYGQQNAYANYGPAIRSYNANAYSTADGYAHWNAYTYNQQANPAAYPYSGSGSTSAPSPGASSYSQYPDYQSNFSTLMHHPIQQQQQQVRMIIILIMVTVLNNRQVFTVVIQTPMVVVMNMPLIIHQ